MEFAEIKGEHSNMFALLFLPYRGVLRISNTVNSNNRTRAEGRAESRRDGSFLLDTLHNPMQRGYANIFEGKSEPYISCGICYLRQEVEKV